ncbi:MAG: phosphate ABC transporter ATP-binding protein [Candidatus Omnitrophota bacterium]|nr:phosphate ABC transporter ATP-binding protein [Candidatus Omnitrophota bacterium]
MVDETSKDKLVVKDLNVRYGTKEVLRQISFAVRSNEILGIIGPANSGKTSLLRTLNRLNDNDAAFSMSGTVTLDGQDIYKKMAPHTLRRKMGIIFALPTPLPLSIYENIAYGPKLHGTRNKTALNEIIERTLRASFLWDEVKDRLDMPAMKLSGGQQQRLCIARTLAVEPEIILYDEPCSGLDPISTAKVEEAMTLLTKQFTQILVTNNTKQAARVSDRTAFFLTGELVEIDETQRIFTVPCDQRTEDYVSGRFG